MTTHLGESPHGLFPDAGKVLQGQTMGSQSLHYLQQLLVKISDAGVNAYKQLSDQAPFSDLEKRLYRL